jgi:ABC-type transport system substrate-binding protein
MARLKFLSIGLVCLSLFQACTSQGKMTVVTTIPETIEPIRSSTESTKSFTVLRYGELDQIRSLDPLFALNPASQRIIQLIFEGLTKLDENGNLVPGIAQTWEMRSDSLSYVFKLNNEVFFHDANIFTSGVGRKVDAYDVYNTFKRMASPGVPSQSASLFLNSIAGFEAYYKEQHELFFEEDRTIKEISGINIIDPFTVEFILSNPDRLFLHKLATPGAVIYPFESYQNKRSATGGTPVGTGPFTYEGTFGDTLIVLKRNMNYWKDVPELMVNQIEVINLRNETELFKRFAREEVDYIAELGPQMIRSLVNKDGVLEQGYQQQYELYKGSKQFFSLYFNANNAYLFSKNDGLHLLKSYDPQTYVTFMANPSVSLVKNEITKPAGPPSYKFAQFDSTKQVINLSYNGNLISGDFLLHLSTSLRSFAPVQMYRTPIVTRELLFFVDQSSKESIFDVPKGLADARAQALRLLDFSVHRYAITNKKVKNVSMNDYSWWLDLSKVTISASAL